MFLVAEISLSPNATWSQIGITITGSENGTSGSSISELNKPFGISISNNDVLYISDTDNHRIVVVPLDYISNIAIIGSGPGSGSNQFNQPYDLFVTNKSLFVIDELNHRIQKTLLNGSNSITVSALSGLNWPYYLHVDEGENIYLSDTHSHRVLLFPFNSTNFTVVAGTGVVGSTDTQLNQPYGVFVNDIRTVYIADYYNHRIMKWFSGASAGIRVAGDGISGSGATQIGSPTQVIVDKNEYLYISCSGYARIIRWAPNASYGVCIAACSGILGIAPTQLNGPHSLAFDSKGSLYVSDRNNHRIQKFQILTYQSKHPHPQYNKYIAIPTLMLTFSLQILRIISQNFLHVQHGILMQSLLQITLRWADVLLLYSSIEIITCISQHSHVILF